MIKITLSLTANTNSVVYNVLVGGGNSIKIVLIADNKFPLSNLHKDKRSLLIKSQRNPQKMIQISSPDVLNAGLILIKAKSEKFVILVALSLFTRDALCLTQDIGNVINALRTLMKMEGKSYL